MTKNQLKEAKQRMLQLETLLECVEELIHEELADQGIVCGGEDCIDGVSLDFNQMVNNEYLIGLFNLRVELRTRAAS